MSKVNQPRNEVFFFLVIPTLRSRPQKMHHKMNGKTVAFSLVLKNKTKQNARRKC